MICKYEWKMWMGQIHHKTPIKECGRPSPFNHGVPCGTDQTMEQADWKFKDHLMENKESYQSIYKPLHLKVYKSCCISMNV